MNADIPAAAHVCVASKAASVEERRDSAVDVRDSSDAARDCNCTIMVDIALELAEEDMLRAESCDAVVVDAAARVVACAAMLAVCVLRAATCPRTLVLLAAAEFARLDTDACSVVTLALRALTAVVSTASAAVARVVSVITWPEAAEEVALTLLSTSASVYVFVARMLLMRATSASSATFDVLRA